MELWSHLTSNLQQILTKILVILASNPALTADAYFQEEDKKKREIENSWIIITVLEKVLLSWTQK